MNPFVAEYHLLEEKTFTSSNLTGFVFFSENTFFPPIVIEYIVSDTSTTWAISILVHSPGLGRALNHLA